MSTPVKVLRVVVALVFLAAGAAKLAAPAPVVETFARFGFGKGFLMLVGVVEVAGAIGLFLPRLAPLAAAGLALVMVGAIVVQAMHGTPVQLVPPVLFLAACGYLAVSLRR